MKFKSRLKEGSSRVLDLFAIMSETGVAGGANVKVVFGIAVSQTDYGFEGVNHDDSPSAFFADIASHINRLVIDVVGGRHFHVQVAETEGAEATVGDFGVAGASELAVEAVQAVGSLVCVSKPSFVIAGLGAHGVTGGFDRVFHMDVTYGLDCLEVGFVLAVVGDLIGLFTVGNFLDVNLGHRLASILPVFARLHGAVLAILGVTDLAILIVGADGTGVNVLGGGRSFDDSGIALVNDDPGFEGVRRDGHSWWLGLGFATAIFCKALFEGGAANEGDSLPEQIDFLGNENSFYGLRVWSCGGVGGGLWTVFASFHKTTALDCVGVVRLTVESNNFDTGGGEA